MNNLRKNQPKLRFGFGIEILLALAAVCAINMTWIGTAAATSTPVIYTDQGPLTGIKGTGIDEFLGIPYAAPPVGKLRWTAPQPHGGWRGVFQATHFGNICSQPGAAGSEDCLFLNIYRPDPLQAAALPVMVWIHGGRLIYGSGGHYDPTPLVEKGGVIVVTLNYRLGVLGFFAHPAMDVKGRLNANYGLMDQQFVLKWLQRNIHAFGGDANRMTIFGQSAGGISVYSHLASPAAAHLFQGAIAESGTLASFERYLQFIVPLKTAEQAGTSFASQVGCSSQTAQCLHALSAAKLVAAEPTLILFPCVDGMILTQPPGSAFANGQFNRVPVISGDNHDDFRLTVAQFYDYKGQPLKDSQYQDAVTAFFTLLLGMPPSNSLVQTMVNDKYPLKNYPPQPPGYQRAPLALGALGTDVLSACPARKAVMSLSRYVKTYAYEFNDEHAPLTVPPVTFPLGAYYGVELQYLFHVASRGSFTPQQQQLSNTMIDYWTQFAKDGNPNSTGAPLWSSYSAGTDQYQSLVPPTPMVESKFNAGHQCSSFWDTF